MLGVLEGTVLDKLASDEQFGRSMTGDALEAGSLALLEALADFFPSRRRLLLRQLLAQTATSLEALPSRLPPGAAGS